MDIINNLEAMLEAGQDSAMLRYTLGNTYLKDGNFKKAIDHLHVAVKLDHNYSAAWKAYAKALSENGDSTAAGVFKAFAETGLMQRTPYPKTLARLFNSASSGAPAHACRLNYAGASAPYISPKWVSYPNGADLSKMTDVFSLALALNAWADRFIRSRYIPSCRVEFIRPRPYRCAADQSDNLAYSPLAE
jgi:tetratricopeptide (TPR) repeat protein